MRRIGIPCLIDVRSSFNSYPSAKFGGNNSAVVRKPSSSRRRNSAGLLIACIYAPSETGKQMVRCPRDDRVAPPSAMIHLLPCTVDHGHFVRSCQHAADTPFPPKLVTVRKIDDLRWIKGVVKCREPSMLSLSWRTRPLMIN